MSRSTLLRATALLAAVGVLAAVPAASASAAITPGPAVSNVTVNSAGKLVFSPNVFVLRDRSTYGCNVTITNQTSSAIALTYGSPSTWKRLPGRGGVIAAGASGGVGVAQGFTGWFSAMGAANYVKVRCV